MLLSCGRTTVSLQCVKCQQPDAPDLVLVFSSSQRPTGSEQNVPVESRKNTGDLLTPAPWVTMALHTLPCFNHRMVSDFPSVWILLFWPGPSLCQGPQNPWHTPRDALRSLVAAYFRPFGWSPVTEQTRRTATPLSDQAGHRGSCPRTRELCLLPRSLCPCPATPARASLSEAAFGDWPR